MNSVNKRVQTNLLEQNVYVRDMLPPFDEKKDYLIDSYIGLDTVVGDMCEKDVLSGNPYPITPDSVNSYADSTDYRTDPLAAMNSSAPGKNIGDVAMYQKILSMDPLERKTFLESVSVSLKQAAESPVVTSEEEKHE